MEAYGKGCALFRSDISQDSIEQIVMAKRRLAFVEIFEPVRHNTPVGGAGRGE